MKRNCFRPPCRAANTAPACRPGARERPPRVAQPREGRATATGAVQDYPYPVYSRPSTGKLSPRPAGGRRQTLRPTRPRPPPLLLLNPRALMGRIWTSPLAPWPLGTGGRTILTEVVSADRAGDANPSCQ